MNDEIQLGKYEFYPDEGALKKTEEKSLLNDKIGRNIFVDGNPYIEEIIGNDVDELVLKGIRYIRSFGEKIDVTAGKGLQAFGASYILKDSTKRLHNLRHPESLQYLCRELVAYFRGSLFVNDGLAQSSQKWLELANRKGKINSNYGYYVFHQKRFGKSQYDWVVANLKRNSQSRKGLININQVSHKQKLTRDFPCTIAVQFLVRGEYLCCEVVSRSEDVILGLPYDMGFFSFLNELICADLNRHRKSLLKLGYTMIKCSFTQIYEESAEKAEKLLKKKYDKNYSGFQMPPIIDVERILEDIYKGTKNSSFIQWIYQNANLSY